MAYYSSNFHEDDAGEYYRTPYHTTSYDIVQFQGSVSSSSYEFSQPKFFEYDSTAYGGAYDPSLTRSEINYSTYNITEPKLIEYNPMLHGTSYFSSETKHVISYSTATQFEDTVFEEYDPTPYVGGYDLTLTYGKPLPSSDEICYPRSLPESNALSSDNFSYGSIPSPYGKDDTYEYLEKPRDRTEPTKSSEEQQQQPYGGNGDNGHDHGSDSKKPLESGQGEEETEGYTCDDYYPWCGYEDYGSRYGNDEQVPQTPYGYGLDAMDLCESIFGHWPCLSRNNRKSYGNQGVGSEEWQGSQWKGAADYLFGSPNTHAGGEASNYGDPPYNHEGYYWEHHYREVEGDEKLWQQITM